METINKVETEQEKIDREIAELQAKKDELEKKKRETDRKAKEEADQKIRDEQNKKNLNTAQCTTIAFRTMLKKMEDLKIVHEATLDEIHWTFEKTITHRKIKKEITIGITAESSGHWSRSYSYDFFKIGLRMDYNNHTKQGFTLKANTDTKDLYSKVVEKIDDFFRAFINGIESKISRTKQLNAKKEFFDNIASEMEGEITVKEEYETLKGFHLSSKKKQKDEFSEGYYNNILVSSWDDKQQTLNNITINMSAERAITKDQFKRIIKILQESK